MELKDIAIIVGFIGMIGSGIYAWVEQKMRLKQLIEDFKYCRKKRDDSLKEQTKSLDALKETVTGTREDLKASVAAVEQTVALTQKEPQDFIKWYRKNGGGNDVRG